MGKRFSLCDQVFLSETREVEVLQFLQRVFDWLRPYLWVQLPH